VVEGARLESVYSGNAIAGSNPALSAKNDVLPQGSNFRFDARRVHSPERRSENCEGAERLHIINFVGVLTSSQISVTVSGQTVSANTHFTLITINQLLLTRPWIKRE
jgi:hypothetical protein